MTPLGKSEAVGARGGHSEFPPPLEVPLRRLPLCLLSQPFFSDPSGYLRLRSGSGRFLRSGRYWFHFLRRGIEKGLCKQKRGEQQGDQRRAPFGEGGHRQRAGRLFVYPFPLAHGSSSRLSTFHCAFSFPICSHPSPNRCRATYRPSSVRS